MTTERSRADRVLVQAAGIERTYRHAGEVLEVLRGVDLYVNRGEIVVLHGRSGSGKTTLLNIVGGLDHPDAGTVRLCGHELTAADENGLAAIRQEHVAFVFQAFGLFPTLSAAENVEVPLRLRRAAPAARRAKVSDALEAVGLAARARHRPAELSGGEQQRVAIARSLASDPDLFVADEPTGQLDAATGRRIMTLLHEVVRERGLGMLVATHDNSIVERADRRLHLHNGHLEVTESAVTRVPEAPIEEPDDHHDDRPRDRPDPSSYGTLGFPDDR